MSTELSMNATATSKSTHNQWDTAIRDAETELRSTEVKLRRLRVAIRTFKENKRLGVKWPTINEKDRFDTDLS
jgi:hypothetical protein